jgi:hypothetical protein
MQNRIDGPTLLELTDQDLHDYLEISNPLHRKKLLGHTKLLRMSTPLDANSDGDETYLTPDVLTANGVHTNEDLYLRVPPEQADRNSIGHNDYHSDYHSDYLSDVRIAIGASFSLDGTGGLYDEDMLSAPKLHPAVAANVRRSQSQPPLSLDSQINGHGGLSRVAEDKDLTNSVHLSENGGNVALNVLAQRSSASLSHFGYHKKQSRGAAAVPGPSTYLVERGSVPMPRSPRAVIGRHRRDISEHFINPLHCSPGAGKHMGYLPPRRVSGGSFGTAARWNYSKKNFLASLGY